MSPLPDPAADPSSSAVTDPGDRDRVARLMVLAMYGLLLLSVPVPVPVLPLIVGLGLAYATRGEAPAVWRSHFDEGIRTVWLFVILMLIGGPLWFVFFIGAIPMAVAYLLLVFRSARGLIRASRWTAA